MDAVFAILLFFLKIVLWIVVIALAALWWCQGEILYMPTFQGRRGNRRAVNFNSEGYRNPAEYNLRFQSQMIVTHDEQVLHSWLILAKDSVRAPTILFFHGNAGNIGFRLPNCKCLYQTLNCNILQIEYRGYGNSSGRPSERGLQLDALAALQFLHQRPHLIDPKRIFLFGRSLGGAVALQLAASLSQSLSHSTVNCSPSSHAGLSVCGVIVENTFTSIHDMVIALAARLHLPHKLLHSSLFSNFLHSFITSAWDSSNVMVGISVPVLFLSGMKDELVPPSQMQALYDLATNSTHRQMVKILTGEHNDTYVKGGPAYYDEIRKFIQRAIILNAD